MTEESITAATMIKGMPPKERARALNIYKRGKAEAAAEVEELLYDAATLQDTDQLIEKISEWVKQTKGIIEI
jgi:hypothetical protein